jgi:hypothetical protein
MIAIAQRLMNEGHHLELIVAARYASLRSATMWCQTPVAKYAAPNPKTAELFAAIDACDDGHDLEQLHAFIEPDYVNWGAPINAAA